MLHFGYWRKASQKLSKIIVCLLGHNRVCSRLTSASALRIIFADTLGTICTDKDQTQDICVQSKQLTYYNVSLTHINKILKIPFGHDAKTYLKLVYLYQNRVVAVVISRYGPMIIDPGSLFSIPIFYI